MKREISPRPTTPAQPLQGTLGLDAGCRDVVLQQRLDADRSRMGWRRAALSVNHLFRRTTMPSSLRCSLCAAFMAVSSVGDGRTASAAAPVVERASLRSVAAKPQSGKKVAAQNDRNSRAAIVNALKSRSEWMLLAPCLPNSRTLSASRWESTSSGRGSDQGRGPH